MERPVNRKKLYECTVVIKYYAEAGSEKDARALLPKVLEYENHLWADHAVEIPTKDVFVPDLDRQQCPVYADKGPYKDLHEVLDKLPEQPLETRYDTWY